MPWPRQAVQSPESCVPCPSCPGRPKPTPFHSLPASQGGHLGQGDPAIPRLLSAQTSPAARGAPAPHPLPAKGEVGVSAAHPTVNPNVWGGRAGKGAKRGGGVQIEGINGMGRVLGSYSPRGQGARWVPGFLSVPGGPVGQEHPHKVRTAPKHLPPRCCHLTLFPERLCPSEKPPAQAEHSPPHPCRLCCPSGQEAPSRPATKRRRVRACGR